MCVCWPVCEAGLSGEGAATSWAALALPEAEAIPLAPGFLLCLSLSSRSRRSLSASSTALLAPWHTFNVFIKTYRWVALTCSPKSSLYQLEHWGFSLLQKKEDTKTWNVDVIESTVVCVLTLPLPQLFLYILSDKLNFEVVHFWKNKWQWQIAK